MRWRELFQPRDRKFQPLLARQAQVAMRGLQLLVRYAESRDDSLPNEMAALEAEGDAVRRRLVEALRQTYITPIDREDLYELSRALDDILDASEDALLEMVLFEPSSSAHALEMARSLVEAMGAIERALSRFADDPQGAADAARRAKQLENSVANLYRYGLYHAFEKAAVPDALKLREIYASLRDLADRIARAADLITDIAVKEK